MFIRRHFYDLTTGQTLHSYMMYGDIEPLTAEQEAEICGLSNWGVFEWTEQNTEVEKNFTEATSVTVDVTVTPPELIFDFTPRPKNDLEYEPEPTEPSYEDYYNAISSELGGGAE